LSATPPPYTQKMTSSIKNQLFRCLERLQKGAPDSSSPHWSLSIRFFAKIIFCTKTPSICDTHWTKRGRVDP
jgi:hypothetical protein